MKYDKIIRKDKFVPFSRIWMEMQEAMLIKNKPTGDKCWWFHLWVGLEIQTGNRQSRGQNDTWMWLTIRDSPSLAGVIWYGAITLEVSSLCSWHHYYCRAQSFTLFGVYSKEWKPYVQTILLSQHADIHGNSIQTHQALEVIKTSFDKKIHRDPV